MVLFISEVKFLSAPVPFILLILLWEFVDMQLLINESSQSDL